MTVDDVVAQLKAEGVRFHVSVLGSIRTTDRLTMSGRYCCPLAALMPRGARTNCFDPEDMADLGVRNWHAVMNAADNLPDHDPAIRALLMTLVGKAKG